MSDVPVETVLRKILTTRLGIAPDQITPEAKLVEDLGMDSLDAVELGIAVEQQFDIDVNEEQVAKLKTVADAVALVEQLVTERTTK